MSISVFYCACLGHDRRIDNPISGCSPAPRQTPETGEHGKTAYGGLSATQKQFTPLGYSGKTYATNCKRLRPAVKRLF